MRAPNSAQQANQSLDHILTEFTLFVKELCLEALPGSRRLRTRRPTGIDSQKARSQRGLQTLE